MFYIQKNGKGESCEISRKQKKNKERDEMKMNENEQLEKLEELEVVDEIEETEQVLEDVELEDMQEEYVEDEEQSGGYAYYEANNVRTKPLGRLILLVAFTAIMLVSSTYAWFSTQKNVTLGGLKGEVQVAEGLQISLDAKSWTNTINLNEFAVDANTKIWTSDKYVPGATFQAPYSTGIDGEGNPVMATNVTPEELLPVSTTGGTGEGIGNSIMNMYWGDNTEGIKLSGIKQMAEEAKSGYYAFDVFLQNTSADGKTVDTLKLAPNSSVVINSSKEATGLQNTVRVGFALYENAKDDAETSNDKTVEVRSTPTTAEIIAGTAVGKKIKDVAIWEPNSDVHVTHIVNSNNSITWSVADLKEYGFNASATAPAKAKFSSTSSTGVSQIPTYALTTASKTAGSIADIYDWATPSAGLTKQVTLQTKTDTTEKDGLLETEALPLISVAKTEAGEENTEFQIGAGQYVKMRVYVWLEGQDVDCTNYASLGGGLTIDIGILKGDSTVVDDELLVAGGPYLPSGYSWANTEHTEILDPLNNQYVWISVPQDTSVYSAETLALDLDSLSGEDLTDAYDAIETDLHTYTSTYRNGTSYKDEFYSTDQHGFADADAYNAHKNTMLASVFKNGGFYVGKYETGIADSQPEVIDETVEARTASGDATQTPVIQANAYPYNYVTNKQAQELASTKFNGGGYTTSLMFGLQWDLVLKHLQVSNAASESELNSDSTGWGNYRDNLTTDITNTSAKYAKETAYAWTEGAYRQKTESKRVVLSTGASDDFERGGIYDLAGNVFEWTLEYTSYTLYPCACRGGGYGGNGSGIPAGFRGGDLTSLAIRDCGFRVSLW